MRLVGVVYPNLTKLGGAEAVCLNIVDALDTDYDVELITNTPPETQRLSKQLLNKNLQITVRVLSTNRMAGSLISGLTNLTNRDLQLLKKSIFIRQVKSIADEYDLIITARDDISLETHTIQYIHIPRIALKAAGHSVLNPNQKETSRVQRLYNQVCTTIAGHQPSAMKNDILLTNSEWTRSLTRELYGPEVDVRTVYPPVQLSEFDPIPWDDRENGFVTVGRVASSKNTLRTIEIISQLREDGLDTHLHVVGPISDRSYVDKVRKVASEREFVFLEGTMERDSLIDLLDTHKYGIHGKENEPFGMVVVEMLGAGMLPFVPTGSGPAEIVENQNELTYKTRAEAIEITRPVLRDTKVQRSLLNSLPDPEENYKSGQFKKSIRDISSEIL